MSVENHRILARDQCPVFVVGCHRSGTNFLYDILLSAGGFAVYRGYLPIYKMLIPRFGSPAKFESRKKIMGTWLRSKGFRRSGLDPVRLTAKVMNECRTGGDFIRITMHEIARQQGARRWAVYDPDNVVHVPTIKRDIPEALFIHIIRDGRDIAVSLRKMGGFQPLPWDRGPRGLLATALYWEWMVRNGQRNGRSIPADYIEVRYEDLVSQPRRTLQTLSQFLDHDLDFDRLQNVCLGRLRPSNSSFLDEGCHENPVNRWKNRLSEKEISSLEALVGGLLEELGYSLSMPQEQRERGLREKWMRAIYPAFLNSKLWLKHNTALGKLANLSTLELTDSVPPTSAAEQVISDHN